MPGGAGGQEWDRVPQGAGSSRGNLSPARLLPPLGLPPPAAAREAAAPLSPRRSRGGGKGSAVRGRAEGRRLPRSLPASARRPAERPLSSQVSSAPPCPAAPGNGTAAVTPGPGPRAAEGPSCSGPRRVRGSRAGGCGGGPREAGGLAGCGRLRDQVLQIASLEGFPSECAVLRKFSGCRVLPRVSLVRVACAVRGKTDRILLAVQTWS